MSSSSSSSSSSSPAQPQRPLLMIPGPIEYHESVLSTLALPSLSHVSPGFINEFGESIELLRQVFLSKSAQPFVLSGSGTLGWDVIISNLVEPKERALVLNTGYFSDSFASCCKSYDVDVDELKAGVGDTISVSDLVRHLESSRENKVGYKIALLTQVDTSTGVKNDIQAWSKAIKEFDSNILVAVDGVCSFGGEEFRLDAWQVDAAMTCSQKALGLPPGLAIILLSQQALKVRESRTSRVPGYFTDLNNWLPIMRAYESRSPSYFATPNVNLVRALRVALKHLTEYKNGIEGVFSVHASQALKFRAALKALGLSLVPTNDSHAANTLSAIWYPSSIDKTKLLPALTANGIIAAGGLHRVVKADYFRIGHMGISVLEGERGILTTTLNALETALRQAGATIEPGTAVKAFNSTSN